MTTQFPSAMNKVSLILSLASGISDTQLKFCDLEVTELNMDGKLDHF